MCEKLKKKRLLKKARKKRLTVKQTGDETFSQALKIEICIPQCSVALVRIVELVLWAFWACPMKNRRQSQFFVVVAAAAVATEVVEVAAVA